MKRLVSPLTVILVFAAILRLIAINHMLWYDEAFTARLVGMSVDGMIKATLADVHPPTWYLIEMPFVHFLGMSETALRLPAAILGVAAVYLTWRLA